MNYGENKGEIWMIGYYTKVPLEMPEEEKQKFLDRQTNEFSSSFDPPPGLSPDEYSQLFLNHYMKSRKESRDLIDKNSEVKISYSEVFQLGNLECFDHLSRIENLREFHSWQNPGLVEHFRVLSKIYLDE